MMSTKQRVQVVTDMGCSFRPGDPEVQECGISLIPLQLAILESGVWKTKQETEIEPGQFYNIMQRMIVEDGELPKTSGLSPGIARDIYLNLFREKDAEAVFSIHVTKAHSQAMSAALIGAQEAKKEAGEDLPIAVMDSKSLSLGQYWIAKHAAWLAQKGADLKSIIDEVSQLIPKIEVLVVLETFENLKKGGRAEQIKGMLASMFSAISIHPILAVKEGKLDLFGRARSASKARKKIVDMIGDMGDMIKMGVIHTNAPALAEEVKTSVGNFFKEKIPIVDAGPALATHAGERAVAVVAQKK
jgi:DegV family protein with EDD domain